MPDIRLPLPHFKVAADDGGELRFCSTWSSPKPAWPMGWTNRRELELTDRTRVESLASAIFRR